LLEKDIQLLLLFRIIECSVRIVKGGIPERGVYVLLGVILDQLLDIAVCFIVASFLGNENAECLPWLKAITSFSLCLKPTNPPLIRNRHVVKFFLFCYCFVHI